MRRQPAVGDPGVAWYRIIHLVSEVPLRRSRGVRVLWGVGSGRDLDVAALFLPRGLSILPRGLSSGRRTCNVRPTPMRYQPIENQDIVGDMRSAALVSLDGSVDWLCPRRRR